jgi:hypothetical protein
LDRKVNKFERNPVSISGAPAILMNGGEASLVVFFGVADQLSAVKRWILFL